MHMKYILCAMKEQSDQQPVVHVCVGPESVSTSQVREELTCKSCSGPSEKLSTPLINHEERLIILFGKFLVHAQGPKPSRFAVVLCSTSSIQPHQCDKIEESKNLNTEGYAMQKHLFPAAVSLKSKHRHTKM